jgi:hypothetical protein
MDDVLTWDEIVEKYPDEWVLIDEPETTPGLDIIRGRLLGHDPELEPVERLDNQIRPRDAALSFTGSPIDRGVVYAP